MLPRIMPPHSSACHPPLRIWRSLLLLFGLVPQLGCAYALISDGKIDPPRLDAIAVRTAEVSGSPVHRTYRAEPLARAALPVLVESLIRENYTEEQLSAMQRALEVLGLWPIGLDYVGESVRVTGEEVAGIYVPQRHTLYVVEDYELPLGLRMMSALAGRDFAREGVLAHEIIHAYQHADYPALFELMNHLEQNDLTVALQAAIEGDATRYGFAALMPDGIALPDAEEFRREVETDVTGSDEGALAESPALVRQTLTFPYTRGYGLSLAEGRALMERPPASSEQVIHASRRRADFAAIDLSAGHDRLPVGCAPLYRDTLGELVISVLLHDLGESAYEGVASGWDGDRVLVASCSGVAEFVWWTQWDTEADAAEFADSYRRVAEEVAVRARLRQEPGVTQDGRRVFVATAVLSPMVPELDAIARLARVATVEEVARHFGLPFAAAAEDVVDAE